MPLTDSYGQNVPFPTLTDKPNAQTLGQGIVENVVPRIVMVFASAVVRGGTIETPTAGMVTYLKDVGRLELFDGDAWVTIAAGTSTWKNVPLASGWSSPDTGSANNNQGRFQYRVVNLFGQMTIMFRGGIGRASYPTTIPEFFTLTSTALPVDAWPTTLRTISVPCSDVNSERITLKMDLTTDGRLVLYGIATKTKPPWVGFNGCFVSL